MERAKPISSPLRPSNPADIADLYGMVLDDLRIRFIGDGNVPALRMLALLGVRHLAGHELLRCLIVGEPGVGKTTLVRTLAECLDVPMLRVPLPETPETTWGGGADLPDRINGFVQGVPGIREHEVAERMVLLLDDMDIVRLKPWETYAPADRTQREGRQQSLLSVWSGEDVMVGDDRTTSIATRRMLVIGCLEGEGLHTHSGSAELAKWGFIPAMADRVSMSTIIRMHQVDGHELGVIAAREAERLAQPAYEAFSYRLCIADTATAYAIRTAEARNTSTRDLIGLLRNAADHALLELVARAAPRGVVRVLGPDDL